MKEFWIYTAMRLFMFAAAFGVIFGLWLLLFGSTIDANDLLIILVLAFLVSGVSSYFALARQRNAFASRVESRAGRVGEKFSEMKSKED